MPTAPPVSGGWHDGDAPGDRQFLALGELPLERGSLPGARLAYETWGTFDGANAVLVCHALTGDAHVTGAGGWWGEVVGPGRPLDTDRWFVVAANVLGGCQGSTGPSSRAPDGRRWGSRFPGLTVRDHVAAEVALADALGIDAWACVVGGSMGGMRALEWAVTHPDRVHGLFVLAAPAATSADQIAWCAPQLAAIRDDPHWHGGDYHDDPVGPVAGLGNARRIAHATYRSERELQQRFGRLAQVGEDPLADGRFAVESYLDHQADKLVRRFDAGSYVALTRVMATHDVGRGRGGVAAALTAARGIDRVVVAGIDSDRLYPLHQQQELADGLGVGLDVVTSAYGHDGFLLEADQVGVLLQKALP
jgi:homoserine O-acetyltransferase